MSLKEKLTEKDESKRCLQSSKYRPGQGYGPCIRKKGHRMNDSIGHFGKNGKCWNEGLEQATASS